MTTDYDDRTSSSDRIGFGNPSGQTTDSSGDSEGQDENLYLVGESPAMQEVFNLIRRYAASEAPILIEGESGTGKELAARAIHEHSACASGPFVPINCGGIPETLISSELFGYERGAFTGANKRQIGRIEAADGGSVLLDEIGDLPLELQPHLLRFLQEGTIDRLGSNKPVRVKVRTIAATNKNLKDEVETRSFRQDLYFRLNVLTLRMPPLRERGNDIDLLSTYFLRRFNATVGSSIIGFADDARNAMRAHDWPGNVRELISRIRRAAVIVDGDWIHASHLGLSGASEAAAENGPAADSGTSSNSVYVRIDTRERFPTLKEAESQMRKALLRAALERHDGNVSRIARDLDVSRVTLYRLLDQEGLRDTMRRSTQKQ